jgi:hypothetical protein
MGFISCGMHCRVQHCSTHFNPGSEAAVEQLSQHYAPLDWDNLPGRATRLLRLE